MLVSVTVHNVPRLARNNFVTNNNIYYFKYFVLFNIIQTLYYYTIQLWKNTKKKT